MGGVNSFFFSPNLGLLMGGVGTGISTAAAYRDAKAAQDAAALNAQTYEQEAQIARIQADTYRQFGEQEYRDTLRQYDRLQGEQTAAYGASGVSANAGSPAAVQANTAAEGIYAAEQSKYQRALQAWEKEREADRMVFEAQKSRASGANPYVAAGASAIGGLTSMYSTYGQWQNKRWW